MLNAPGGVGSYNPHDIVEEVEWRSPLLYANPLGHCVPAALKICQKYMNANQKRARGGAMRGAFVSLIVGSVCRGVEEGVKER